LLSLQAMMIPSFSKRKNQSIGARNVSKQRPAPAIRRDDAPAKRSAARR
jgi:hypothetical protein